MGVDLRRGAIQKDDASQVAVVAPPGSRVDQRVLPAKCVLHTKHAADRRQIA